MIRRALDEIVVDVITGTLTNLTVRGRENVPGYGPALVVANNVSYLDPFLIARALRRRAHLLVPECYRLHPDLRRFFDVVAAVPVPTGGSVAELHRIYAEAAAWLRDGQVVVMFPEGQISRTGNILPMTRGVEEVARSAGAPILPVHVDMPHPPTMRPGTARGILEHLFGGRIQATISFGERMASATDIAALRLRLKELEADAFAIRREVRSTLARTVVASVRRRWNAPAVADSTGRDLTYGRLLVGAFLLARYLGPDIRGDRVGILLPASVGACLANLAVALLGKVSVNLNFTASRDALLAAQSAAGVDTVITSRAFLERVDPPLPDHRVYLEDVRPALGRVRPAVAYLTLRFMPAFLLRKVTCLDDGDPDATATILFSSGSTGDPKGVMLSHANILANLASCRQLFHTRPDSCFLGSLPFFHAFGLTLTFWFPLSEGVRTVYHPNPMEGKEIGDLCERYGVTILVSTPAFASRYLGRVPAAKFGSLQFGFVGAERLGPQLAAAFRDRYGVDLYEGYGATECAPVVAGNVPAARGPGYHQRSRKAESIGHPIPGVAIRLVHPETGETVGVDTDGVLWVKGPNVMQGYLDDPERTNAVLRDGWYVTGDVVRMDRDGYLRITGRLSRFSKIAGEMVPHGKIEEIIQTYLGESEPVVGVTAVPSDSRGERIVVLHTVPVDPRLLASRMRSDGYPNLWVPRADGFVRVEELPLLPTGKLALGELHERALRHFGFEVPG
jgi:acyl-[acyl-carrier-protein]-phospholipid O-acyltransferase/long-chain-fatty-acid--[acyl-carrier-protein] ligase